MKAKPSILKNALSLFLLIFIMSIMQFCKSSKNVTTNTNEIVVSYTQNIAPLLAKSCTPCHFPERGKKKMLNTFGAVKDNIDEILMRVQLPESEKKYMPFRSKKPALTKEEIDLLKKWVSQRMAE